MINIVETTAQTPKTVARGYRPDGQGHRGRSKDAVKKLARTDWLKLNPEWEGICVTMDEIVTRPSTRKGHGLRQPTPRLGALDGGLVSRALLLLHAVYASDNDGRPTNCPQPIVRSGSHRDLEGSGRSLVHCGEIQANKH